MNLEEQINADIKAAMLAKDSKKLEPLRAIKSGLLLLKTSPSGLTDEAASKEMMKMVKQRKETAEIYKGQNREDLAEAELYQASVIEAYLPKQMSEDEVREVVSKVIADTGASSPADMGKVMGVVTKQLAGKAEGKMISQVVKDLLSK